MKLSTSDLARIALLAAASAPLALFGFPLPFFVGFLRFDFSDTPAVIATCSIGPLAGVLVELAKSLASLALKDQANWLGELSGFLAGAAYVLPLGIVCSTRNNHRFMTRTHIVKPARFSAGAAFGAIAMVAVASLLNLFLLIPLSADVSQSAAIAMGNALNPGITSMWSLAIFSIAPFYLLKAVAISVVGYLFYRLLERFL
jgi:riboflavin transporter FmnP